MMRLLTAIRLVQKNPGQDWTDVRMQSQVWAAKGLGDPW